MIREVCETSQKRKGKTLLLVIFQLADTWFRRQGERCVHAGVLHGAHPTLASPSRAGAARADGPAVHALPRRWLQPGRLYSYHSGCRLWCLEGQRGSHLLFEGFLLRGVCCLFFFIPMFTSVILPSARC